jgi:hypothetical protein
MVFYPVIDVSKPASGLNGMNDAVSGSGTKIVLVFVPRHKRSYVCNKGHHYIYSERCHGEVSGSQVRILSSRGIGLACANTEAG